MARTKKSYLEEAASNRKFAKGLRIYGIALYVLAGIAAAFVVWMFLDGHASQAVTTSVSTLIIGFWGWFARHFQAPQSDDLAKRWEQMHQRYGHLHL